MSKGMKLKRDPPVELVDRETITQAASAQGRSEDAAPQQHILGLMLGSGTVFTRKAGQSRVGILGNTMAQRPAQAVHKVVS